MSDDQEESLGKSPTNAQSSKEGLKNSSKSLNQKESEGLPTAALMQDRELLISKTDEDEGYRKAKPVMPFYLENIEQVTNHAIGDYNELVRRRDVEALIQKHIDELEERAENDWHVLRELEMLLDEVQQQ